MMRLHFLPVTFRIKFKIGLMVFKCMNNLAPKYLASLIKIRSTGRYSVRLDNDYFLLEVIPHTNIKRAEGAFSFIGPRIWNELPFRLRCMTDLPMFKKSLKTHYFNLTYPNTALEGS